MMINALPLEPRGEYLCHDPGLALLADESLCEFHFKQVAVELWMK